jgi:hypothetical protein
MTTFTDTDLKRLKRYIERAKETPKRLIELPEIELEFLLARLEAAEAVASHYGDGTPISLIEAWRKAAGK